LLPQPVAVGAKGVSEIWLFNEEGLIVTFDVVAAFAASRTVMSTAVSAVTARATAVKVEPTTAASIGRAALLLEKAWYAGFPPVTVNVVGRSGKRSAVGGETATGVPAAGSVGGGAVTAPLPQEPSKDTRMAARKSATPRSNRRFIITKLSFRVVRHHRNNVAKVLASIGILPNARSLFIIRASCNPRIVRPSLDSAQDKNVAARKMRRYYRPFQE
jgi:hypothetical protein